MLTSVNLLNCDRIKKIKIEQLTWDQLFQNKTILYEQISNMLLNEENLLYYLTQKESSKTLVDTKQYVKNLLDNDTLKVNIKQIMGIIGWNKESKIESTIFQGDLAEYLMNILLDKFTDVSTIISKISLKTSTGMPVYGNDNYYYDYSNDILYFGESKFYNDTKSALDKAIESIRQHKNIQEIYFVKNHTTSFIAENSETRDRITEKFETVYADDIEIKNIIFVMADDMYKKQDYEKFLAKYYGNEEKALSASIDIIMVFLPVLSKTEFLKYFYRRISNE